MNVAGGMRTNDRKCFKQGGKWKGGCLRQGEERQNECEAYGKRYTENVNGSRIRLL